MAFNLGEAQGRITLDIAQFMGAANQAQGAMGQLDGAAAKGASGFQKFASGFNAFGLAMIPAVGIGINSAIDLEQAMANINASLGGLDTSTLNELTKGFQDLGAASQFSATEVAKVGDELAKSGFDPSEILNATEAVVDLSQATGADLMTSTTGISAVMHIWTEEIVGTKLALTDASEAADIFTVAANESSASVEDIIAGVRNFGPTAAGLHIGFNDAAGAIAFFTQNGLKAADSGVSLTRGIEDLMKVAQDSPEVLSEMGIAAFDLEGNFIGLPALFDQLQTATAGMTDEQRQLALSTIFGAESIDVMTIAALNGGDPLRALIALTEEQGVASEQSALRMDTLGAQFDTLKEGATTLLGSFMAGLIPGMRFVVDGANRLVDVFMKIPGPIKTAIGAVMALAAGFAALNLAIKGMALFSTLTGGVGGAGLVGSLGAFVPILLAVAAAAGVAYAAIRFNFLGIGDAVRQFIDSWNAIGSLTNNPISRFLSATSAALRSFDIGILNDLADAFSDASDRIGDAVDGFQQAWDFFFGSGDDAQKDAKKTTKATGLAKEGYEDLEIPLGNVNENLGHLPGITADANDETTKLARTLAGTEYPTTRFGQALTAVGAGFEGAGFPQMGQTFRDLGFTVDRLSTTFQQFRQQGLNPIEAGVLALGRTFPALQTAMVGVYGVVNGLGDAFSAAVRGDWAGAFDGLAQAARSAGVVLGEIGNVVVNIAGWVMGQIPDIWAWLRDTAIPAMGAALVTIGSVTVSGVTWVAGQIDSAWEWLKRWVLGGGNASGVAAGGAAAGGSIGGGIDLGAVALRVSDWIISSASSIWERIKQFVLGTGGGVSGGGRAAGGNVATAAGAGIPIGAVPIAISGWTIVANAIDVWTSITDWVDSAITVTDAEAARFEPKGREIGSTIVSGIWDGIAAIFSGGGVSGGGAAAGGGGTGPLGAGGSFGNGLWRFIEPVIDGAFDELQARISEKLSSWKPDLAEIDWSQMIQGILGLEEGGVVRQTIQVIIDWEIDLGTGGGLRELAIDWTLFVLKMMGLPHTGVVEQAVRAVINWELDLGIDSFDWPSAGDLATQVLAAMVPGGSLLVKVPIDLSFDFGGGDDDVGDPSNSGLPGMQGGGQGRNDSFFGGIVSAIQIGATNVAAAFDAAGVQWAGARDRALASLSGGGTAGLGAAVGGGAAGLLGGLVTSVTTGLAQVTTAITTSGAQWSAAMAASTTQMTASATVGFIGISTAAQAGMAAATAAVVSGGAQMSAAMGAAGAAMSAAATSAAQTTASVLQAGMAAATGAVASNAAQWPGIIAAAGGAMGAAGFYAGQQAGLGVASGLMSTLGAVQSAANAIIATVAGAMTAAAQIHSPSRLTWFYGRMMGFGLIGGLDSMQSRVAASSAALMQTASPYLPQNQPGYIAGGGGVNAPITIRQVDIHTQGAMSDEDKKGLAQQFGEALKTGVDIQYVAHGASS